MKKRNLRMTFRPVKHIKGTKPRNRKAMMKIQHFFMFFLCVALIAIGYNYLENKLLPSVIAMSQLKIQTMATGMINDAVKTTLTEMDVGTSELSNYQINEEGYIISSGVNTILINHICSDIIQNISEQVDVFEDAEIEVPLGNLIGQGIFTDWGPNIKISILPYGTAQIDYGREFTTTGINQINHRIWLDIQMSMKVIFPFEDQDIIIAQEVTLVDEVITGTVPDQFIQVPKEDITNVID